MNYCADWTFYSHCLYIGQSAHVLKGLRSELLEFLRTL
uniref:Uncharacterized protein n=1 Tax=Rhizophora mucronata TaxID=61149 RepID=A0A2P2NDI3_RHIMU